MLNNFATIAEAIKYSRELLLTYGETVTTESWQGVRQEAKMFEFLNCYWAAQMPNDFKSLIIQTKADLPWVDIHFQERVGGDPLNPGESYKQWPFYKNVAYNDKNFRKDEKFSHTYMERYWPKNAGGDRLDGKTGYGERQGIRYGYGDLRDVINLLAKEPYTRQAYLPVFFPEDTGAVHGGRIPCTIGYHFIMRNNKLNIHYQIRACDFLRHFRNDIYLTIRLAMWVLSELKGYETIWDNVALGLITFDCVSLHVFEKEKNLI